MATYNLANVNAPTSIQPGDIINCTYCGTYKSITLPSGQYQLECWGARGGRGGNGSGANVSGNANYGRGGYSKGIIRLRATTTVYLYAGGAGADVTGKSATAYAGGWNGGGNGGALVSTSSSGTNGAGGGGASDIRIGSTSLYARVIVAGGGGGASWYSDTISTALGGAGGGTSGIAASIGGSSDSTYFVVAQPGSATAGGAGGSANSTSYGITGNAGTFGSGGNGPNNNSSLINSGAGGGGGWYGGGSGFTAKSGNQGHGAGGSGYVYTSSTASNYPSGCELNSSYYLTDASTKAGNTSFIDYSGSTVIGHADNGAVRITAIQVGPQITDIYLKIGENNWKKLFDLTSKKPPVIPVTINLTLTSSTVIVNDISYTTSTTIETVNPVNIIFTLQGGTRSQGEVTLNGTTIYTTSITSTTGSETFTWTPSENYSTITINCNTGSSSWYASTTVTITTA